MSATLSHGLDIAKIRGRFPALDLEVAGKPAVFLDGPGGTQMHVDVIEAMSQAMRSGLSNNGGAFAVSRSTDVLVESARAAMADFLGAGSAEEVVFGQNMTSLTFSLSRALAKTWQAGDEIVLSRLDHDANVSPWLRAAEDRGVTVRWLDFKTEDCRIDPEDLAPLLNGKTRLVALTYASNAVGSITEVKRAAEIAHAAGALIFIDAVHYAPHGLIDVQTGDFDFLACSTYKFFGPHTGVLYGKRALLEELAAYKVRPAYDSGPGKWETGTQSFESIAGVGACVESIAALSGLDPAKASRRERIVEAYRRIAAYEHEVSRVFLDGAAKIPGLEVFGVTDRDALDKRTPTFGIRLASLTPQELAAKLGDEGIFVWDGHFYAVEVIKALGLEDKGGLLRIGFVHYNTLDEVQRLLESLTRLAQ